MIELQNTELGPIVEMLASPQGEGIRNMLQIMINAGMLAERRAFLGAAPYERTEARQDYANGYKTRSLKTKNGELELKVPQVRSGNFFPSYFEKGLRSDRALRVAMAEMYVSGVSTRKVARVLEETCGVEVTSQEVSRSAQALDEEISRWRNRKIGSYVYLLVDAIYCKIREAGVVRDAACLVAIGIDGQGRREILGTALELSEAETCWRSFFQSLQERGLHGLVMIISDNHAGLKAARKAVFPSVPWQRCQFHLQQNAQSHVPKESMKAEVAADLRAVFNAPSLEEAERLLGIAKKKYEKTAPRLADWMEGNVRDALAVFLLPASHRRRLRTTNMLERLNLEIRRRIKVISSFPNAASALRLMSAVLMEKEDEWADEKRYVTFS